jgi:hypothetical protein
MRKWKVLAAILAVAFVVPTSFAQTTQEQILQEMQALKNRVSVLESENAELKGSVADQNDQELESQISALTDRLVAGTTVKSAANPVTLTGEFRFRNSWSFGDNDNDGSGPGTSGDEHDGSWTDALVRLGFQYEFTRDVTAFAELQAHWAYGDGVSTAAVTGATGFGTSSDGFGGSSSFDNGTNTQVRMHQAWLEVRNIFDRPEFSNRTGRQEIVLGNQFQFGNADWYSGWSFDGTRWDWDSESFSLTGMILKLTTADGDFNQVSSFFNSHDDDELYALYFTLKTIKNHELDLYWIYINGHGSSGSPTTAGTSFGSLLNPVGGFGDTAYYHTVGGRIGGVFPDIAAGLDWNAEFAYQFGDANVPGTAAIDIDAFAVEAELGLTFNKESMFRVFVRFLWAEGPENNELPYIPLFPNRHSNSGFRARYGVHDLIPMTNVISVQGGLHFDPAENWTLGATFLWAAEDEDPALAGRDDDYGIEIDVWAEYRYSEHLVFNVGVAFVFPDNGLEDYWAIDDDLQFLGYIQARLLF